ncbi:probable receptor-like protein kinase At1g80640 [Hibiscus syriacus]|uniref:probable receptor-like protein kinase At1g80640 n=1 Tax=Hibiscus syriacus TaxID=106335 RepID=UPI00192486FA|nr:probable receptor-like protein kinase At1g80640 [Hibiscus syriacus]
MKKKFLPLLLCLVSFHEAIVVFVVRPWSEENKRMSLSKKMLIALGVACSSLGVIISSLFGLWICYKKDSLEPVKNNANNSVYEDASKEGFASFIDYKVLAEATNKFHQSNILGIGGFGCVYKAQFIDGSYAAVKKLGCSSHDAEQANEVDSLSKFKHLNIISLLDLSSYSETRFTVYELMQNGYLETQLHGKRTKKLSSFNLSQRSQKCENFVLLQDLPIFRSRRRPKCHGLTFSTRFAIPAAPEKGIFPSQVSLNHQ